MSDKAIIELVVWIIGAFTMGFFMFSKGFHRNSEGGLLSVLFCSICLWPILAFAVIWVEIERNI